MIVIQIIRQMKNLPGSCHVDKRSLQDTVGEEDGVEVGLLPPPQLQQA